MAQQLYERHSCNVHLDIIKRHMRLSRQIKGAESLVTNIEPFYNELLSKADLSKAAKDETEGKRDLLSLKDALLDDKVRDLNEACKKIDRDNPGTFTLNLLFPDGLSAFIYAPIENEPTEIEKLILSIKDLGSEHILNSHIAILQAAIDESKTAISELHEAIKAEKMANALQAIAKTNLTRQYEQNIYAASSKFGKVFAKRLFPAIHVTAKKAEVNDITENIR